MTTANLDRRLRKIEHAQGLHGDLEQMTAARLWRIIRADYRHLAVEHGSLAQAAMHLRATSDIALATLIEEDTGGPNAVAELGGDAERELPVAGGGGVLEGVELGLHWLITKE